jgi:uncharacterized protein (DUF2062 family)
MCTRRLGAAQAFFCREKCFMKQSLERRFAGPILELLKQGATPEKLALSIALGAVIGVFPALGTTTTICALLALALGLNLPAVQLANYAVYPAQIALLLPFFRLGEKLFGAEHVPLSAEQVRAMVHANPGTTLRLLWSTLWHAMVAWSLVAPLFAAALYAIARAALRRALGQEQREGAPAGKQAAR